MHSVPALLSSDDAVAITTILFSFFGLILAITTLTITLFFRKHVCNIISRALIYTKTDQNITVSELSSTHCKIQWSPPFQYIMQYGSFDGYIE